MCKNGCGAGIGGDEAKEKERKFLNKTDFRIIAVTNRFLSEGDYFLRIGKIAASGVDAIIVREKGYDGKDL